MHIDEKAWTLATTLAPGGGIPRTVHVSQGRPGFARVEIAGDPPEGDIQDVLLATVRHILSLDVDLAPFYRLASADPELAWATAGAGRMIRSPTVFEEVIKTLCTTNCSWAATIRMVSALVAHLGQRAPGAPERSTAGRTFPTPQAIAAAPESFYRMTVGAGYRAPHLRTIAVRVAEGSLDLEALGTSGPQALSDAEVDARLKALPGIGPYSAAHIGLMLGRTSALILDSWTRPTYARLRGKTVVSDRTIQRRFKPYGRYAGLAFWLFCTRDWVEALPSIVQSSSPPVTHGREVLA